MSNVLPPGTPRAWLEAQETGQTVRGYEPGVLLPEEDLTPPHVLAERMVRRMERNKADGAQWRPSMPKARATPRVWIEARQVTTADGGQTMRPQAWVEATPKPASWSASEQQTWTDPRFWMDDPSDAPSCNGPLKNGNLGMNGRAPRGGMTLQGIANGQIADPTLKAKRKARRARRARMIVVRPAD